MEVTTAPRVSPVKLLIPALAGALVALSLGVYGQVHDPTGESIFTLMFTKTINMKVWFATAAAAIALFQLFSSLRIYGKIAIPRRMPSWYPKLHRITGAVAFLLTLPVAYHCLWALGFQDTTARVLVHGVAGCFFYGAFVAKCVVVNQRNVPGWGLPVIGGLLFSALVTVWLTSSLWFFDQNGFPAF